MAHSSTLALNSLDLFVRGCLPFNERFQAIAAVISSRILVFRFPLIPHRGVCSTATPFISDCFYA